MGMELAQVAAAPMLGDFEAGLVASLTTVKTSIVSGGIACVGAIAVLAAVLPALDRYRRPPVGSVPTDGASCHAKRRRGRLRPLPAEHPRAAGLDEMPPVEASDHDQRCRRDDESDRQRQR